MRSQSIDLTRHNKSCLLSALRDAGADVSKPGSMRCPFHDDSRPSSSVFSDPSGVWRFKCHGCGFGGDVFDVISRTTGKAVADVLIEQSRDNRPIKFSSYQNESKKSEPVKSFRTLTDLVARIRNVVDVYEYETPSGQQMAVIRCESENGKRFFQASTVESGWVFGAAEKPWGLYDPCGLDSFDSVIVVEGEKCVVDLRSIGLIATTSPGGAGKAHYADWSRLAGKTVYLWPDNDPVDDRGKSTGRDHMMDVAKILESLDPKPSIFLIDPSKLGLPDNGDVCDFIKSPGRNPLRDIAAVLRDADPIGVLSDVSKLIGDTINGKRRSIDWPWDYLGDYSKSLLPGTLTILCGLEGSGKSFFLLQAVTHWFESGHKIAMYCLEESRAYHLYRVLVQRCERGAMFDDGWVRDNGTEVEDFYNQHKKFLNDFGACVHAEPNEVATLDSVADWVEDRLINGCRIVVVDPISIAFSDKKPWIADQEFMSRVGRLASQYESSVVLATHPRAGHRRIFGLDAISGGKAYTRFAQSVLWMERLDKPQSVSVETAFGNGEAEINRIVRILKSRNGRGGGVSIGFDFTGSTMKFTECGPILDDD